MCNAIWLCVVGLDTSLELARQEYVHDAIIAGKISLLGVMTDELANCGDFQNEAVPGGYQSISTEDQVRKIENSVPAQAMDRLDRLLKPFFRAYDLDNNNTLSVSELTHVFRDLGERLTEEELEAVFVDMDTDKSGAIDYKEFVHGTAHYIITQNLHLSANKIGRNKRLQSKSIDPHAVHQLKAVLASEGEEDEEHEEVPEDIKDLSPEEQQRRIKFRSAWMMTLGTVIVLVISDPVVEVLGEIGKRTGVPAFYISFLLAPLASNAAELIAVYNYSRKKTAKTVTISLATLQVCFIRRFFMSTYSFLNIA